MASMGNNAVSNLFGSSSRTADDDDDSNSVGSTDDATNTRLFGGNSMKRKSDGIANGNNKPETEIDVILLEPRPRIKVRTDIYTAEVSERIERLTSTPTKREILKLETLENSRSPANSSSTPQSQSRSSEKKRKMEELMKSNRSIHDYFSPTKRPRIRRDSVDSADVTIDGTEDTVNVVEGAHRSGPSNSNVGHDSTSCRPNVPVPTTFADKLLESEFVFRPPSPFLTPKKAPTNTQYGSCTPERAVTPTSSLNAAQVALMKLEAMSPSPRKTPGATSTPKKNRTPKKVTTPKSKSKSKKKLVTQINKVTNYFTPCTLTKPVSVHSDEEDSNSDGFSELERSIIEDDDVLRSDDDDLMIVYDKREDNVRTVDSDSDEICAIDTVTGTGPSNSDTCETVLGNDFSATVSKPGNVDAISVDIPSPSDGTVTTPREDVLMESEDSSILINQGKTTVILDISQVSSIQSQENTIDILDSQDNDLDASENNAATVTSKILDRHESVTEICSPLTVVLDCQESETNGSILASPGSSIMDVKACQRQSGKEAESVPRPITEDRISVPEPAIVASERMFRDLSLQTNADVTKELYEVELFREDPAKRRLGGTSRVHDCLSRFDVEGVTLQVVDVLVGPPFDELIRDGDRAGGTEDRATFVSCVRRVVDRDGIFDPSSSGWKSKDESLERRLQRDHDYTAVGDLDGVFEPSSSGWKSKDESPEKRFMDEPLSPGLNTSLMEAADEVERIFGTPRKAPLAAVESPEKQRFLQDLPPDLNSSFLEVANELERIHVTPRKNIPATADSPEKIAFLRELSPELSASLLKAAEVAEDAYRSEQKLVQSPTQRRSPNAGKRQLNFDTDVADQKLISDPRLAPTSNADSGRDVPEALADSASPSTSSKQNSSVETTYRTRRGTLLDRTRLSYIDSVPSGQNSTSPSLLPSLNILLVLDNRNKSDDAIAGHSEHASTSSETRKAGTIRSILIVPDGKSNGPLIRKLVDDLCLPICQDKSGFLVMLDTAEDHEKLAGTVDLYQHHALTSGQSTAVNQCNSDLRENATSNEEGTPSHCVIILDRLAGMKAANEGKDSAGDLDDTVNAKVTENRAEPSSTVHHSFVTSSVERSGAKTVVEALETNVVSNNFDSEVVGSNSVSGDPTIGAVAGNGVDSRCCATVTGVAETVADGSVRKAGVQVAGSNAVTGSSDVNPWAEDEYENRPPNSQCAVQQQQQQQQLRRQQQVECDRAKKNLFTADPSKDLTSPGVKDLASSGVKDLASSGVKDLASSGVKDLKSSATTELSMADTPRKESAKPLATPLKDIVALPSSLSYESSSSFSGTPTNDRPCSSASGRLSTLQGGAESKMTSTELLGYVSSVISSDLENPAFRLQIDRMPECSGLGADCPHQKFVALSRYNCSLMDVCFRLKQWHRGIESLTTHIHNNYLPTEVLSELIHCYLHTDKEEVTSLALLTLSAHLERHPPCSPALKQGYARLLIAPYAGKYYPRTNKGLFDEVLYELDQLLKTNTNETEAKKEETEKVDPDAEMRVATSPRVDGRKVRPPLPRATRLRRLSTVLSHLLDVLERDLLLWLSGGLSPSERRASLTDLSRRPAVVSLVWPGRSIRAIGTVNGACRDVVQAFHDARGHTKVLYARLLALLAEVVCAAEEPNDGRYPNIGAKCTEFAREITNLMPDGTEVSKVTAKLRPSWVGLLVVHQATCRATLLSSAEPSLEVVIACVNLLTQSLADEPQPIVVVKPNTNVNKKDCKGEGKLHVACRKNNASALRTLLGDPYVDVNLADNQGWTPLHEAAAHGSIDCVELLLAYRPSLAEGKYVDTRAKNVDGQTALMDAVYKDQVDIARMLLKHAGFCLLSDQRKDGSTAYNLCRSAAMRLVLDQSRRGHFDKTAAVPPLSAANYSPAALAHVAKLLPTYVRLFLKTYNILKVKKLALNKGPVSQPKTDTKKLKLLVFQVYYAMKSFQRLRTIALAAYRQPTARGRVEMLCSMIL